mgnify:CR=1 FL=1
MNVFVTVEGASRMNRSNTSPLHSNRPASRRLLRRFALPVASRPCFTAQEATVSASPRTLLSLSTEVVKDAGMLELLAAEMRIAELEKALEEARSVYPYKDLNSLNTVGYKEIFKYLDGEWTLDFAIEKIKQNSRIYSRKQMTWFKRDADIAWFHPDQQEEIMEHIKKQLS